MPAADGSTESPAENPANPDASAPGGGWLLNGRYRVIDRIGTGGMAEVFRAHDEVLRRDVAVKVFRRTYLTADPLSGTERQKLELQALACLNHPNLVILFDGSLDDADGPAHLVMELVDGSTLKESIAGHDLTDQDVRAIGMQIAAALAYVHGKGMVHRDVKPANILLGTDVTSDDETVRARLSDFGVVRIIGDERLTSADSTLGTANYLAPEQTRGSRVGPPADVYALGLVLLEALTGVRAFDGPPLQAAMERLSRDPLVPGHLAQPWPAVLAAMTAREPEARPSAAHVVALLGTLGGKPVLDPSAVASGMTTDLPRLPAAAPVAVSAAAAAAAPAFVGAREPEPDRRAPLVGWLVAAAVAVIALGIGGVLLLNPARPGNPNVPATRPASVAPNGGVSAAAQTSATRPSASKNRSSTAPNTRPASRSATTNAGGTSTSGIPSTHSAPATTSATSAPSSSPSVPSPSPSSTAGGAVATAPPSP